MKRSKICGLLLASFIMLGLSLSVSLDVNASKYSVDTLPFYVYNSSIGQGFQMTVSDDINPDEMYGQYIVDFRDDGSSCVADSYTEFPVYQDLSNGFYFVDYTFSGYYTLPSSFNSVDRCKTVQQLSDYNADSINLITGDIWLQNILKNKWK